MEFLANGQTGDAKRLLLGIVDRPDIAQDGVPRFGVLRALARAHREDREFDHARTRAMEALEVARRLRFRAGEAVMLEGLALIEAADGNLQAAGTFFLESADAEAARGDYLAMALALNNYANMLVDHELEGAEPLLARALAHAPRDSQGHAVAADNMASEMERQGRHEEAVGWATDATDAFRKFVRDEGRSDFRQDLFIALRNLSRHLANVGRRAEAAEVFEEAHDLIHELRLEQLDESHYADYPERVKAIEERSATRLSWFEIGALAVVGEDAYEQGVRQLEEGRYADAIESLITSRKQWIELEGWHRLVRVDHHLALAYVELGRMHQALPFAVEARARARDLGDAFGEAMALTALYRLRYLLAGEDPLDLIAQAHALQALMARAAGNGVRPEAIDGGVLAGLAAAVCADAHAFDLAERYMEVSLAAGRELPDASAHRLAQRLHNFYRLLWRQGEHERAAPLRDELDELVSTKLQDDPRGALVMARVRSREAFYAGDRSPETLAALLEECRAYEDLRRGLEGAPLTGLSEALDPPFEEAAEVALALERPGLALELVQLGKARTMLEALDVEVPALPDAGSPDPAAPPLGDAVGLELLITESGIVIFVVDGASGELEWSEVPEAEQTPRRLGEVLRKLTDAADSERGTDCVADELDAVLHHPTFAGLSEALLSVAGDRGAAWLAPHRFLHQAPLQLAPSIVGTGRPVPWSLVPALPLVAALPSQRPRASRAAFTVCGDSDGTLPFARAEARLVAGDAGHLAVGDQSQAAWLREHCERDDLGVLHLACHGRFDRGHPERSGLVLSAPSGEEFAGTTVAQLLTVEQVAGLELDGVLVTLSACSSGLEAVRDGDEATGLVSALLRAGAAAIVAAQWPIPDLSAMLLMVEFYDSLTARLDVVELGGRLDAAAARVREMTAEELVERGFELAERVAALGGTEDEAVTVAGGCLHSALVSSGHEDSAELVRQILDSSQAVARNDGDRLTALEALRPAPDSRSKPFGHPHHWGAFAVVGRGRA
jgi:CHAT domain-containing protein